MTKSNHLLIMPANYGGSLIHYWQGKYGNLGNLFSPFYFDSKTQLLRYKTYNPFDHLPYALDNGKFICFNHSVNWDETMFLAHCDRIKRFKHKPLFIVVPDEVTKGEETIELYKQWQERLRTYNTPLALAVQDGMTVEQVHKLALDGVFDRTKDFIFVGGSTDWKLKTLPGWCKHFNKVHLARVNTWKRLWQAKENGCFSCDGTGWFRGDLRQKESLESFLAIQSCSVSVHDQTTLPWI